MKTNLELKEALRSKNYIAVNANTKITSLLAKVLKLNAKQLSRYEQIELGQPSSIAPMLRRYWRVFKRVYLSDIDCRLAVVDDLTEDRILKEYTNFYYSFYISDKTPTIIQCGIPCENINEFITLFVSTTITNFKFKLVHSQAGEAYILVWMLFSDLLKNRVNLVQKEEEE